MENRVFKKILLASTAFGALASTAFAADLPSRRAPVPYVAVPVFTWTGFYVGVNAGYGFNDSGRITTTGNQVVTLGNSNANIRVNNVNLDRDGFTGGGQIGYNYQFGAIVVGIEADAQYTDFRRTGSFTGSPNAAGLLATSTFRTTTDYIGTVRGRVGYAFDRLMVYGTGGFAYGEVFNSANFFQPQAGGGTALLGFTGSRSRMETGYTAGAGVEYALPTNFSLFNSSAVTLKAEALYYDLGRSTYVANGVIPATAGTSYTVRSDNSGVLARVGLNFKFGTF